MNQIVRSLHCMGLACVLTAAASNVLGAQDPCDALVARAFNEFDVARRVQLLQSAVQPTACPPRGAWPVGVQLLAQTLMEDGKEDLAAVWLRWAIRLSPDLQPDTVQFLPRVVSAYRTARDFVQRTRIRGDSAAPTTWLWPTGGPSEPSGGIQIASSSDPLRVEIEGIGLVAPGGRVSLPPGSYLIAASTPGRPTLRVTREVLPGATTVVEFRLPGGVAQAPPRPAPPPVQPAPTPAPPPAPPVDYAAAKKKGFPMLPVVLGGVGVVAVIALLAGGGGDDGPATGSITITFPNP